MNTQKIEFQNWIIIGLLAVLIVMSYFKQSHHDYRIHSFENGVSSMQEVVDTLDASGKEGYTLLAIEHGKRFNWYIMSR